jgi:formate dehydrogenase major subunit
MKGGEQTLILIFLKVRQTGVKSFFKKKGVISMSFTRRKFLKTGGAGAAGLLLSSLDVELSPAEAKSEEFRIKGAKETTSVCCFCSVGCGMIVHTDDKGKVINIEGDPEHPINEGALCAKGAASYQIAVNDNRLKKVLYRAPYGEGWKEVSWDWALDKIAANIKKSRDESFMIKNFDGLTVNRTNGIASVGSAALDNEECWLYAKFLRSLGLMYIEHQARI